MPPAIKKKTVFEAALALKPKDRELLAEELLKSLYAVDEDRLIEEAKLAHRRIKQSDRDPSRLVSEEEVLKLLSAEDQ